MATRPNILATLEHEGAMWTVVMHDDVKQATTTLHYVRDWIVGGTRRIVRPLTDEIRTVLTSGPASAITDLLRGELTTGMQRRWAIRVQRSTSPTGMGK